MYDRKPAFVGELLAHIIYVAIFSFLVCVISLALPTISLKQTLIYSLIGCFPWIASSVLISVMVPKVDNWHTASFDPGEGYEHLSWLAALPPTIVAVFTLLAGMSTSEVLIVLATGYVFGLGSIILAMNNTKMRLAYAISTKLGYDRSSTNIT